MNYQTRQSVNEAILIKPKQRKKIGVRLGLDFDNNFPNNDVTTLIAQPTIKHQKGHIIEIYFFEFPLLYNTFSKWERIQNKNKYTNFKNLKLEDLIKTWNLWTVSTK